MSAETEQGDEILKSPAELGREYLDSQAIDARFDRNVGLGFSGLSVANLTVAIPLIAVGNVIGAAGATVIGLSCGVSAFSRLESARMKYDKIDEGGQQ